jgi:NifU-like protein
MSIIERVRRSAARPAARTDGGAKKISAVQKIRLIEETLDREVRPSLRRDGGDVELVDVEGSRVVVSLRGMCAQCRVAEFTLKEVVEAKLREFVSPDLTVEQET